MWSPNFTTIRIQRFRRVACRPWSGRKRSGTWHCKGATRRPAPPSSGRRRRRRSAGWRPGWRGRRRCREPRRGARRRRRGRPHGRSARRDAAGTPSSTSSPPRSPAGTHASLAPAPP
uniref:Uncharacterized protein n=1 Tax=Leersia perrieri TaxID=77586 RepID=A0A0D9XME8_9ORYZ